MSEEQKKLEPNPEHLAKLKEGVEVWNEWVQERRHFNNRFRADLKGAFLNYAKLKGVDLRGAELEGADLSSAKLEGALFIRADLRDAKLEGALFIRADLRDANFEGANLRDANFEGADLSSANFEGADLQDANLTDTNLAYAKNILFSDNKIKGATISSTTKAPWLTLTKNYTNTMLLFTLATVFAFFLPYIVNIAMWRSVNLSQELMNGTKQILTEMSSEMQTCDEINGSSKASCTASMLEKASIAIADTKPCLAEECKEWKIYQLLLGVRRNYLFAALSIVLIVYNFFRIYLTQQVSVLRDSEQKTGLTPRWQTEFLVFKFREREIKTLIPIGGYQHLYYMHKFVEIVFFIAITSFAVHSIAWLNDVVHLPL